MFEIILWAWRISLERRVPLFKNNHPIKTPDFLTSRFLKKAKSSKIKEKQTSFLDIRND